MKKVLALHIFLGYSLCILQSSDIQHNTSYDSTINDICGKSTILQNKAVNIVSGTHILNSTCEVKNAINITLIGESRSGVVIQCSPNWVSGFRFFNVTMMVISGIEFSNCGASWTTTQKLGYLTSTIVSALLFVNGSNISLENVTVSNAKSAGLYIYNVGGRVEVDSCRVVNASSHNNESMSGNVIVYDYLLTENTNLSITNSLIVSCGYMKCNYNSQNLYSSGLALFIGSTKLTVDIAHLNFTQNKGCQGGNMAVVYFDVSPVTVSHTIFNKGHSLDGGGVNVYFPEKYRDTSSKQLSAIFSITNSTFANNIADWYGGGFLLSWDPVILFNRSLAIDISNTSFDGNSAMSGSAIRYDAIFTERFTKFLRNSISVQYFAELNVKQCIFSNHSAAGMEHSTVTSVISVYSVPYLEVNNIIVSSNDCTAILAVDSSVVFSGSTRITNNRDANGAGVTLANAYLSFKSNSHLIITNNTAERKGGGVMVYNYPGCLSSPSCFYQLNDGKNVNNFINFTIVGNTAAHGGDNIYCGRGFGSHYCLNNILTVPSNSPDSPSSVSSDPEKICITKVRTSNCTSCMHISIYPGGQETIYVQIQGNADSSVSDQIYTEGTAVINDDEKTQIVPKEGKYLNYTFYLSNSSTQHLVYLVLQSVNYNCYGDIDMEVANITVHFKNCPFGFAVSNCACQCYSIPELLNCSIQSQTITKKRYSWVGMFIADNDSYIATSGYCPLGYCHPTFQNIKSHEGGLDQDEQCQYNRTGILCGSCPEGQSLILGSSECRECSNTWLLLVLPFALAGLVLVFAIHFLNFTVTMGTVCGLIFYTNIIQDYSAPLLSNNPIPGLTTILLIFLSWFNLDLGISTCFYQEMGAFGKSVLLFIFPIYIWLIVIIIIILSHRYLFFTRFVGENAVKVLSTLFLLSYSKMLRITVGVLNVNIIKVYINSTTTTSNVRWALDGNIPYSDPHHLFLIVLAVLFIMLLLPFSASLLCIRYIYSLSNYCKVFSFIDKLKPFFDTYTGPFNDNAQYWTGLLLFVRLLVLLLRTVGFQNLLIPFYIITTLCLLLSSLVVFSQGTYKKWYLNVLEQFFILNIGCIFLINTYQGSDGLISITSHVLVSLTFIVFIGILLYHVYLKLLHCGLQKRLARWSANTVRNDDYAEYERLGEY